MTDSGNRRLFVVGLLVAIALAVVAAQFASSNPDGLEFVAGQEGFLETAEPRAPSGAPLADYADDLTSSTWLNTAIAGLAGVSLTLAIGYGVFWLARRALPDDRATGSS